jgi:hypothetical protein
VVGKATDVLMGAEFGMAGYEDGQLDSLFGLLRDLRVATGDFTDPAAEETGQAGERHP